MLQLARIFQDGLVLQREKEIAVWGSAAPLEAVQVSVQGQTVAGTAQQDGSFRLKLSGLKASKEEELVVKTNQTELHFKAAVGDVWILGGQSNMEFHMRYEKHLEEEKDICQNYDIHFFDVPKVAYAKQWEQYTYNETGIWMKPNKDTLDYFSAVGYYFAKDIAVEAEVPIGLIGLNWGGTRIASWMEPESVKKYGAPWFEEVDQAFPDGVIPEEYYENMTHYAVNDKTQPFADPYSEYVMKNTVNSEEVDQFMAALGKSLADRIPAGILPWNIPGALYEHMVKTVMGYACKGFLWYQGESDDVTGRQCLYGNLLKEMIRQWREDWEDAELPFYIVQLPGFRSWMLVDGCDYPELRAQQQWVTKEVPNTYLCSISDLGDEYDIHPKNKRDVGKRLAGLALKHEYGKDIAADAPYAESIQRTGDQVRITFANAKELHVDGDSIHNLVVLCDNEPAAYTWSTEGNVLYIKLPKEAENKILLGQENYFKINLYNEADIPVLPFEV